MTKQILRLTVGTLASSRLGYSRAVGGVEIKVRSNGPYKVTGHVRVVDAAGNELACPEGEAVALCRCGNSQTKPFCDASHRRVGWVADERDPRGR